MTVLCGSWRSLGKQSSNLGGRCSKFAHGAVTEPQQAQFYAQKAKILPKMSMASPEPFGYRRDNK
jgi:hypothetical protein